MNPAEIVTKVLGEHELTGISYGRWECQCLAEGEYTPGAHRAHVASEIVSALGLRESTIEHWCNPGCGSGCNIASVSLWRTEPVLTEREPLTAIDRADAAEWFEKFTAQAATTPQAHVPAQERPNPANVGAGEGTGLEGAQIGAHEIKPERPREGE